MGRRTVWVPGIGDVLDSSLLGQGRIEGGEQDSEHTITGTADSRDSPVDSSLPLAASGSPLPGSPQDKLEQSIMNFSSSHPTWDLTGQARDIGSRRRRGTKSMTGQSRKREKNSNHNGYAVLRSVLNRRQIDWRTDSYWRGLASHSVRQEEEGESSTGASSVDSSIHSSSGDSINSSHSGSNSGKTSTGANTLHAANAPSTHSTSHSTHSAPHTPLMDGSAVLRYATPPSKSSEDMHDRDVQDITDV